VHVPQKVKALNADFVVFSAHKLFASTGLGAVIGRKPVLDACDTYQTGGGMIALVEHESSTYLEAPARFEAGTQPIAEIYALGLRSTLSLRTKRSYMKQMRSCAFTLTKNSARSAFASLGSARVRRGRRSIRLRYQGCTRTTREPCSTNRISAFAPDTIAASF
jgi:selenocysteine lyase/cysteine desulfurase